MVISKIESSGKPILTLDVLSDGLCVYDLERTEDGTVLDGRFNTPENISFYGIDNDLIPWSVLVLEGNIQFQEKNFTIKSMKDPLVEDEIFNIIQRIPVPDITDIN